jgi:antitoxin ChpS
MTTVTLRTLGGSVVLAVPKQILGMMRLGAGSQVDVGVVGGKLVVAPQEKPRYTLAELLSQCDFSQPMTADEQEWLDSSNIGREEI